jgi:hypothetical protein
VAGWFSGFSLIVFVSAFQLLSFSAFGANPVGTFATDLVWGQPFTNALVSYEPLSPVFQSNRIVVLVPFTNRTDSTGAWTTNLVPGVYRVTVRHPKVNTEFTNCVPDTSEAINLLDPQYICGATNQTGSSLFAYNRTASDARFALRTNAILSLSSNFVRLTNGAAGGITNLNFRSNVLAYVTNGTATIDVVSSGSSGDSVSGAGITNLANSKIAINGGGGTNNSLTNVTLRSALGSNNTFIGLTEVVTNGAPSGQSSQISFRAGAKLNFEEWSSIEMNQNTWITDQSQEEFWNFNVNTDAGKNAQTVLRAGDLNSNQFSYVNDANNFVAIKSGALLTNISARVLTMPNVTASRVLVANAQQQLTNSAGVDTTELEYLDGVTSALQTQLDGKATWAATTLGTNAIANFNGTGTNFSAKYATGSTNAPFVVRGSNDVAMHAVSTNGNYELFANITYNSGSPAAMWRTNYAQDFWGTNATFYGKIFGCNGPGTDTSRTYIDMNSGCSVAIGSFNGVVTVGSTTFGFGSANTLGSIALAAAGDNYFLQRRTGFGTATPLAKLDVSNSVAATVAFAARSIGTNNLFEGYAGTNRVALIDTNGNAFFSNDVSALTFTDRSDAPDSLAEAKAIVRSIEGKNGKLDHSKLHPRAWGKKTIHEPTGRLVTNVVERATNIVDGVTNITPRVTNVLAEMRAVDVPDQSKRNLSMVASAQSWVIQDLEGRLTALEAKDKAKGNQAALPVVLGLGGLGVVSVLNLLWRKK